MDSLITYLQCTNVDNSLSSTLTFANFVILPFKKLNKEMIFYTKLSVLS